MLVCVLMIRFDSSGSKSEIQKMIHDANIFKAVQWTTLEILGSFLLIKTITKNEVRIETSLIFLCQANWIVSKKIHILILFAYRQIESLFQFDRKDDRNECRLCAHTQLYVHIGNK